MITFRPITEDNFDAIIAMRRPEEENFVASNAESLAQCWLYRDNNDVFPFAIYADEEPVGFLLLEEDMDENTLILSDCTGENPFSLPQDGELVYSDTWN